MLPRNYARNVNRWSWSKQELRPILTCHPHTRNYTTRKTFCIRKFMTHSCKKIQNCCKFRVHDPSYIFLETFLQNSWINATHMLWSHQYINFYDPLRTLWMYCATECKQQCHTSICHHHSTAVMWRQRRAAAVYSATAWLTILRLTQWLSDWILHWQGLNLQLAFTALQLSHRKSIFRHDWNCHARSSHYSYLLLLI